jgi:hypothetical protein
LPERTLTHTALAEVKLVEPSKESSGITQKLGRAREQVHRDSLDVTSEA